MRRFLFGKRLLLMTSTFKRLLSTGIDGINLAKERVWRDPRDKTKEIDIEKF
jgi:hypothetical protein